MRRLLLFLLTVTACEAPSAVVESSTPRPAPDPEHIPESPPVPRMQRPYTACRLPDGFGLPEVDDVDVLDPDALFAEDALPLFDLRIPQPTWEAMCDNAKEYADWMEARREHDPAPSEFQHASERADLFFQGQVYRDVGVRFRGQSNIYVMFYNRWSRPVAGALDRCKADRMPKKASLRIDLDRFVSGRTLVGQADLNLLGREGSDASYLREFTAQHISAGFGLPAPRIGHARLCRNGRYQGVYTLAEDPDSRAFISRLYPGSDDGGLWEIRGDGDQVWDRDWTENSQWSEVYSPIDGTPEGSPGTIGDLLDLGTSIREGEPKDDPESLVDVDEWLRNIAVDLVIPDYDGMWGNHKNHLLYEHPDRGLVVLSYDKDLALVGLGSYLYGTCGGSIWDAHPCWSNRQHPPAVAGHLLATRPDAYRAVVEELLAGPFHPDTVLPWLADRAARIRPWVAADRYYQPGGPACDRDPTWCQFYTLGAWDYEATTLLEDDIRSRWGEVRDELDGVFECPQSCDPGPFFGLPDGDP